MLTHISLPPDDKREPLTSVLIRLKKHHSRPNEKPRHWIRVATKFASWYQGYGKQKAKGIVPYSVQAESLGYRIQSRPLSQRSLVRLRVEQMLYDLQWFSTKSQAMFLWDDTCHFMGCTLIMHFMNLSDFSVRILHGWLCILIYIQLKWWIKTFTFQWLCTSMRTSHSLYNICPHLGHAVCLCDLVK